MNKIVSSIGPLHAVMIILALAVIATLLIASPVHSQARICPTSSGQVSLTTNIVISGDPWTEPGGYYSAPGDKVTMTFDSDNIVTVTVDADEKFEPAARIVSWLQTALNEGTAKALLYENGSYGLIIHDSCNTVSFIGPKD